MASMLNDRPHVIVLSHARLQGTLFVAEMLSKPRRKHRSFVNRLDTGLCGMTARFIEAL
jgi:hypothetical protein